MNKFKKLLSILLVAAMVMSMMAACQSNEQGTPNASTQPNVQGQNVTYTVTIQSAGKLPLKGIAVQVYEDDTLQNLLNVVATNEDGQATLQLPASDKYAFTLGAVPKGYSYDEKYTFTGGSSFITLKSAPVQGQSMSGADFQLGDVIYDFEVTDAKTGEKTSISQMLETKKMVLLNVFYTTCSPCNLEMPYMQKAYEEYEEDVGVIAISPYAADNVGLVAQFKDEHQLTFPVAKVPNGWNTLAKGAAYPCTYVIDRYGVICLIESGALTSMRPFRGVFEYFTADDYEQKLCHNGLDDVVSQVKPTVERVDTTEIGNILGTANGNIVYSNNAFSTEEEEDHEYNWPFQITEKLGYSCMQSSNKGYEASYSILYADVTLKKGEAIGFDYLISSEAGADIFHVIVDDVPIYSISGVDAQEQWKACYPWVAQKDGTYRVGLAFIKDDSDPIFDEENPTTNIGDDAVYVKNFRIIDAKDIDADTFLPMEAATTEDGFVYDYVNVVYNEKDGYYHVGSENGPLLLANLMGITEFNEETSLYLMALDKQFVVDGYDYADDLTPFASYASNSQLPNYCTVNKELAELLKKCIEIVGFEGNDNEWLKVCKYYAAYGPSGNQLQDPIAGLATFSALEAQLGYNELPYMDGIPIMPRGKLAEFIPSKSGVYRITSRDNGRVESAFMSAWIFNEDHEIICEALNDERVFSADNYNPVSDVTMLYYMEAGKSYFIDIAYWDPYTVGTIPYTIEFLGSSYNALRMCSPGSFTYNADATGDNIYEIIHGFFKAVLREDGYYYEDLGKDANGNQIYGNVIYADFTGTPGIFSTAVIDQTYINDEGEEVVVKGLISKGGFEFLYSEDDQIVLGYIKEFGIENRDQVEAALLEHWGEAIYAENEDLIDDVFNGVYHGDGQNYTEEIKSYISKMETSGELKGCVKVDARLAELLQMLMDKYTFEGVDQCWLKLCYYYDYLGA